MTDRLIEFHGKTIIAAKLSKSESYFEDTITLLCDDGSVIKIWASSPGFDNNSSIYHEVFTP